MPSAGQLARPEVDQTKGGFSPAASSLIATVTEFCMYRHAVRVPCMQDGSNPDNNSLKFFLPAIDHSVIYCLRSWAFLTEAGVLL